MTEISAAAVKALRDKTDLPMMLCKKALIEAGGDEEKAKDILKREGLKVKEKRADNPTEEGRIFTGVAADGDEAVMVEVVCESPPVATGQDMARFGEKLVKQFLQGPGAATPEELLAQKDPDGSGKTLAEIFDEMINKIREKIVVTRIARMKGPVGAYVHHDYKTGVLFQASGEKKTAPVLKDVAMHIAALGPVVCYPDDLDPALVEKERERLRESAKKSGKPDNIIDKIVEGQLKTFYNEAGVLTFQPFAKEQSKTVSQVLAEQGLKAAKFLRWAIGRRQ
jgi:elongation factor Ts